MAIWRNAISENPSAVRAEDGVVIIRGNVGREQVGRLPPRFQCFVKEHRNCGGGKSEHHRAASLLTAGRLNRQRFG